tara:strand:+ start:752 stop:922 length:171 start_codon:yes stop_codon:yes gene_type:complete
MTPYEILMDLLHQLDKAKTDDEAWYFLHAIHSLVSNKKTLLQHLPENVFQVLYQTK